MRTIFFLILLSIITSDINSQDNSSLNKEQTEEYLKKYFKEFLILSKEMCLKQQKNGWSDFEKNSNIDYLSINNGRIFLSNNPHYYGGGGDNIDIIFNINDIIINKPIANNSFNYKFSLPIKCKNNKECISFDGTLINNISLLSNSQTNLNRLSNAFLHLQNLSENVISNRDPFDEYKISESIQNKLSISNINFKDKNQNNRIDESEQVSLIINLKNHTTTSISNLIFEIKELNKIKGLILQGKQNIPTILGNQTSNIEISINSNNELEIGEANFEIKVLSNNVEITKKTVKIATFNSGPDNFVISKLPDVDINIPKNNIVRRNTYAIIIGNEDYKSKQPSLSYESNVKFAVNDAKIFKEYLINTLGIPNTNITYLTNATSAEISQAINKLKQIPLINPNAEIIFYFAGHGLPDDKTKEQYLIPVDVNNSNLSFGIKINDLEKELTANNPKKVLIILDACFSGAARNESLLANRAVRVRPKENVVKGNTIILSSSSNEESAKAYDEMQHGMFTYYLLKRIQETKGNVDLQNIFDYLYFNVREKSLLINNQIQTPTITKSSQIQINLNEINF